MPLSGQSIHTFFIILEHMLLSDAGNIDPEEIYCETVRESESIKTLLAEEQQLLVDFLRAGIETRRIRTADQAMVALKEITDVLNDHGIHPVIMRKNAVRRAKQIRQTDRIDHDLLCEVEIVKN